MSQPLELTPEQLHRVCPSQVFSFGSTQELKPNRGLIEQERPFRAIRFGLEMSGMGYNIYVAGLTGTGKNTAIKAFLQDAVKGAPPPKDWIYVNNFSDASQPIAIGLPAGLGRVLKKKLEEAIDQLRGDLPKAFESKDHEQHIAEILNRGQEQEQLLFDELQKEASSQGLQVRVTKAGISLIALHEKGTPLTKEQFEALTEESRRKISHRRQELQLSVNAFLRKVREVTRDSRKRIEEAVRSVGLFVIENHFSDLQESFREYPEVLKFLHSVQQDILDHLQDFLGEDDKTQELGKQNALESDPFAKYGINILVDNSELVGPPIIIETNPTYYNLFGRLERHAHLGTLLTDFKTCGRKH